MQKLKKTAALLMALVFALAMTGCTTYDNFRHAFFEEDHQDMEVIKIGVFEPLTGTDAAAAADEVRGMELAHELFPEIENAKIEFIYGDNQSDVEMARTVAQQLVDQGADLVLGSYRSTLSLAGSDIFEAASVPVICATCTNPLVTQTNEFYFRVCFIDAYQGISAAKYITDYLGRTSAACLKKSGDDFANAMIEQFQKQMEKTCGSGSVVVVEYPANTEDITPYLNRIRAAGMDCVFFPSTSADGSNVLSNAEIFGFNWVGCSKWADIASYNSDFAESMGWFSRITYVQDFDIDSQLTSMTEQFIDAYKAKYGENETPSESCALGFDAYLLALQGLRDSAGTTDGVIITAKLKNVRGLEGATGVITMNSQGDPTKDVVIKAITSEGSKAVFTASPN